MFSAVEENYIKGLISSYYKEGYSYYICHSVTETNNSYDIYIYLSKNEITAITPLTFDVTDGIFLKIDSSTRNSYNDSNNYRLLHSDGAYTGIVSVDKAEFIYSNASVDYDSTTLAINPDIVYNGSNSYFTDRVSYLNLVILFVFFLYIFLKDIFRVGK